MIAHEAVHNVFCLIDPTYLKQKPYSEPLTPKNSLGVDNLQLIFALGFWKKLVYTVNLKQALDLCFKFTDLYNYQILEERVPSEHQQKHAKTKDVLVLKLAG